MEISISEEQNHLLGIAENTVMPLLIEHGNTYPTAFVHTGENVRYFQFEFGSDLEVLREQVATTIKAKCPEALAYVLAYDSTVDSDGEVVDALVLETGDSEEKDAIEFGVLYNRKAKSKQPRSYLSHIRSLLNA